MKKLSIISLSILLALSLSVTAWAVTVNDITPENNATKIPVTGTYQAIGDGTPVYSVDITWGSMEFTYQASGGTWDPETHTYSEGSSGTWTCENGANQITITNHSNVAIYCDLTYASSNDNQIQGTLSPNALAVASAEGKSITDSDLTQYSDLTLSGSLSPEESGVEIGTITVTFERNNNLSP